MTAGTQLETAARRPGRVTKFVPSTVKKFLRCIARGMPQKLAASACGVSQVSICNWKRRDPAFDAAVERAICKGVDSRLRVVEECMKSRDESVRLRSATWFLTHAPACARYFAESNRLEFDGDPLAQIAVIAWPHQQPTNLLNDEADDHIA